MRIVAVIVLALLAAVMSPALAQTAPPSAPLSASPDAPAKTQDQLKTAGDYTLPVQPRGRYSFAPVDEGFLRFDHKDGEVALCKPGAGGWSCEEVDDKTTPARQKEQADNEKTLQALRDDIAGLKKDVAGLRPPPHPVPPDTVPPSEQTGSITLKHDIARARGIIADTWHRVVDMIDNMRKDMIRKGRDTDLSRT